MKSLQLKSFSLRCFFLLLMGTFLNACAGMHGTELPMMYAGKLVLGEAQYSESGVTIPVKFDGGQLNGSEALTFKDFKTEVKGKYIYITVRVYAKGKTGEPGEQLIHIKDIEPGSYYVYYRNPNKVIQVIKSITIKGDKTEIE